MFAWSIVLLSAVACGPEPVAPSTSGEVPSDSPATSDSVAAADTLVPPAPDTLPPPDSTSPDSAVTNEASPLVISSVPYGPYHLMNSYTTYAWGPAPFTASLNGNTGAGGVIKQIDAARAKKQKLMLSLTDGFRSHYQTNGQFDIAKWKGRMAPYNTTAIKAAIARGIADGTIIGNQVINEPNLTAWGTITKATVDQLCRHVKSMFPTLPSGPVVVHWWRPTESYRACDFIIDQYGWTQQSMGPGTYGGKGDVVSWRTAALAQAKKEGIAIAFSMNILGGGQKVPGCPLSTTGGPYGDGVHCRLTASQVRQFGVALGPYGCAMFMWKYEAAFWSKSANIQAFKDVAAKLATSPGRSCRRTI